MVTALLFSPQPDVGLKMYPFLPLLPPLVGKPTYIVYCTVYTPTLWQTAKTNKQKEIAELKKQNDHIVCLSVTLSGSVPDSRQFCYFIPLLP